MKVWLLDNGSIVIEHTQLMWNVPGPQVRIPVYSVLIESDDGLVLFDTGIDLDHMNRVLPFELPEQTEAQTIPAQLAACGFGLGDVTTLVNSHLHIDHVGGNQLFKGTGVRNVMHERELAQGRNHEPFELFGYSDHSWDYEGANIETVSGDHELAKGLRLYETPGHTVGHYSLLVDGAAPMLFAADVLLVRDVDLHRRSVLDVGADHGRPLDCELVGDRLPDPLRGAGDDRDPVVQLAHVPS